MRGHVHAIRTLKGLLADLRKNCLDTFPITARSLQKPYHIKGDDFERAYKDFLSGYRSWKELSHAENGWCSTKTSDLMLALTRPPYLMVNFTP